MKKLMLANAKLYHIVIMFIFWLILSAGLYTIIFSHHSSKAHDEAVSHSELEKIVTELYIEIDNNRNDFQSSEAKKELKNLTKKINQLLEDK